MAGIDNIRSGHSLVNTNRSSAKAENTKSSDSQSASRAPSAQQDAVSLSDQGKSIGQMPSQLAASPSFDSAKVQAIKEAIANGSYVVNADKLADNMIRFEKELGGLNQ
jgi:negative regulator of flagellin synthesis FlgM